MAIQTSPLRARTPTKIPSSQRDLIFACFESSFTLYKSFSPNSKPSTVAFLPLHRSYAVFPSLPTFNRLSK